LGEIAQHRIELPQSDGERRTLKAYELNPLAGCGREGGAAVLWVDPVHVIVTRPRKVGGEE
jgi:hypothetical protein